MSINAYKCLYRRKIPNWKLIINHAVSNTYRYAPDAWLKPATPRSPGPGGPIMIMLNI